MFDRERLLFCVIISFAVYSQITEGNVKLQDMSSNVVDDQYQGCRDKAMEKVIQSGLLKAELNSSEGFQKAWSANSKCLSVIPGGIREHTAALSVLHFADADFMMVLDKAVETQGMNLTTYENDFQFKSLHFLLMDALMLQNQTRCKPVYAFLGEGTKPEDKAKVRFASFTVVHSDIESLGDLDGETVLKIHSCFYLELDDHICQKNIFKTLLSPAEVFVVTAIGKKTVDDSDYTEVTLEHDSVNSTHNCFMFPRSAASVSTGSFTALLVAFSVFYLCL
uniref:NAD(P)(+)--arginine ADP-ribosyltransferase n=1 Tax=Nothobranchius kadleci TaxID=1051664 RepID=A0A1A8DFN4_NOTKA